MDLYLARGRRDGLKTAGRSDCLHLCFDWESFDGLRRAGRRAAAWEDSIPADEAAAADPETERLAGLWYRRNGRDFTLFRGLSLGEAYRFIFYSLTIRPAVKLVLALDAAVEEHRPGAILCETSVPATHRETLRAFAAARGGLELCWVESTAPSANSIVWSLPSPALGAPKRLVLGLVNLLAAFASPPGPRAGLAVSYYPTLEGFLDVVARERPPFRCLLTDTPGKEALPALVRAGAEILLDHRTEPAWKGAEEAELSAIREDWRLAKDDAGFRDAFAFDKTSLWPVVEPAGDDFFAAKAGPLAWLAARLDDAWARERPAVALLPYDEPPIQHLVTAVARKRGTPTVAVLHGLPEFAPPPFGGGNATLFAAWGPTLAKRCAAPGPHGDRVCVDFGNPHFDPHFKARRPEPPASVRRILVLSSPARSWIMLASDLEPQAYATTVCDALRGVPARVVFKLHPAESLSHYLRLLKDFDEVEVIKDKPILECLREADLVIGSFSTTLLEAVILNKPVLLVNLTRAPFSPPFDGKWGVEPLRSHAEIGAAVRRVLERPGEEIPRLRAPYARIVGEFAGPADGMASERLLYELLKLAQKAPKEAPGSPASQRP